ncbi:hypothetical protein GWK47_026284 [Chionoecetes opilio]|uniref:Uncharacterized protein n=1 Tax=Chionoecetes opilio TaxID=41210 RepID=A0A8J8WFA8_CHIOP|nr:hypothetical protein GWK47_026284 [Chionoecetes opilio]
MGRRSLTVGATLKFWNGIGVWRPLEDRSSAQNCGKKTAEKIVELRNQEILRLVLQGGKKLLPSPLAIGRTASPPSSQGKMTPSSFLGSRQAQFSTGKNVAGSGLEGWTKGASGTRSSLLFPRPQGFEHGHGARGLHWD